MATSFVSDTIFAGLKTQFEDAMRTLVRRIAEGEGLDLADLESKYLTGVMMAPKTKPKPSRAATVTVTDTAVPCSCKTAKGKPCSLKVLPGTTMCRVHTKKTETAEPARTGVATGPIKDKKPKTKKPKKRPEPMHTHDLDEEIHRSGRAHV